jgi:hypothetical protein
MLSKKNKKYRSDRLKLSSVRSHAAAAESNGRDRRVEEEENATAHGACILEDYSRRVFKFSTNLMFILTKALIFC